MPDLGAYRFTATHEWVAPAGDKHRFGITDHAQAQLGDVIFLELPEVGTELKAGARFGTIESVKAASELYAPVGGTVSAVNAALSDAPEKVNSDPYGEGWIVEVTGASLEGTDLMDQAAYEAANG